MSTYVISDIHGCFDEFQCMLKRIKFSDTDLLIIAGDCIDRGNKNKEMMEWLMHRPANVICIKGNHDFGFSQGIDIIEQVMIKAEIAEEDVTDEELQRCFYAVKKVNYTFDYYGTIHYLITEDHVPYQTLLSWKRMCEDMPMLLEMTIEGKKFIIVHAGYVSQEDFEASPKMKSIFETRDFFLMSAREEGLEMGGKPGHIIVAGHTPTLIKGTFYNNGKIWKKVDEENQCTFYDIDCGAAYAYSHGSVRGTKLACLRLDDEKEFYVRSGRTLFR